VELLADPRRPQRQRVADHRREPVREHLAQPRALERVVELGLERVDVDRQAPLAP
jgi:hypothetical protein